jgi:O-antigen chain-terminating methyltransferase
MLEVDGQVVDAAELVRRVNELVQSVDSAGALSQSPEGEYRSEWARLSNHLDALRTLHDQMEPPGVGLATGLRGRAVRLTKRAAQKLTWWYVEPRWAKQREYNVHSRELLSGLSSFYKEVEELHQREMQELRLRNLTLRRQVVTSLERVNRLQAQQNQFLSFVREHLRQEVNQEDMWALRKEVEGLLQRLGAASVAGADIDYVAFEDRFRGPASEVRTAQERYVGLFPPPEVPGIIVDVGCGRGEMLEVLQQAGHEILGADTDPGMIQVCRAKDLPVVREDGIRFLEHTEGDSLKGIFCAQVVEHLLTSEIEQFVRLAQQKLRPGGVLIVETINPRSLFALGNHFYADTSHVRPVHPETLRFICEQVGFRSAELEERSPHPMVELVDQLPDNSVGTALEALLRSFFGYQDYVIIATK